MLFVKVRYDRDYATSQMDELVKRLIVNYSDSMLEKFEMVSLLHV